ncbi:MAG TPA: hypothetical protein VGQ20_14730 [Acidimicrobiales bacterium]|jgi:hypothetical protein|nr:hypothetical protein [Acidimicrobiales bacterium]
MRPQPQAANHRREEVTISAVIDDELIPELWQLYAEAFEPMRELALLCHLYPRELFEELVADARVFKVIGWRDGQPVAFAAVTNVLDLVPQISPPFLRRRYPEQALRQAIFFAMFICVAERFRTSTMFARLIAGMGQVAATREGLVVCDISQVNRDADLDSLIGRIVNWFPGSRFDEIDSQHYYAAVLPETLDRLPFSKAPLPQPVIDLRAEGRPNPSRGQSPPTADDASVRP